jgi:hypothetical protein
LASMARFRVMLTAKATMWWWSMMKSKCIDTSTYYSDAVVLLFTLLVFLVLLVFWKDKSVHPLPSQWSSAYLGSLGSFGLDKREINACS